MKFPKKLIAFGLSLCMSQIAGEDNTVSTDQITKEEFPGSDIGTETDEAESSESEEIQQDLEGESTLEEPSAVIRKAEGTEEAAAPEEIFGDGETRSSRKIYSQMIFRQQALPKKKQMWRAQKYICMR